MKLEKDYSKRGEASMMIISLSLVGGKGGDQSNREFKRGGVPLQKKSSPSPC